ncbi:MAG TPA: hypothetical protein VGD43_01330, partial [Micromonospora sp.]
DTGSMGGAIANIQAGMTGIVSTVAGLSGGNYQLALASFKDDITVHEDLAPGNQAAVSAGIAGLAAGGGWNEPEASDEATSTVVNNLPALGRPQNVDFTGTWRSSAFKIVVLVTDARPGGFDDNFTAGVDDTNAATVAGNAAALGIAVSPVYVQTNPGLDPTIVPIMQNYATATGGVYTQTPWDGSGSAAAIENSIREACHNRTDIYIRDYVGDAGIEPHTNSVWTSPDIKVCPTAVECAVSQNPIVGVTNYVFVKLNNPGPYGSGTGFGNVHLYRTTPGGGTMWSAHWTPIGVATGVTAPAGVTTVMIPWTGVPGPGHFCLLARWVSVSDPMSYPETTATVTNTQQNNNIAWRNVDSVRLRPGTVETRPFAIGNTFTRPSRDTVVITHPRPGFLEAGGTVIADLGTDLFRRWQAGGMQGTGIRPIGGTRIQLTDPARSTIGGILLNPGERPSFTLTFATTADTQPGQWVVHVAQWAVDDTGRSVDVGGVEYQVSVNREQ